jgi:apoptosis-inducing factor 3
MTQAGWRRLAGSTEVAEGAVLARSLGRMEFLVTRAAGEVRILGTRCTHEGCRLSPADVRAGEITCPCHGARFEAASGRMLSPPALDDLPCYRAREEDGAVYVGPPEPAPQWGAAPARGRAGPRTIVIVGGGAAGSSCAETLRREGFDGRISLMTEEADPPCNRPALSKGLLTGETPVRSLSLRPPGFLASIGVELLTSTQAAGLDLAARAVLTSRGKAIPFDAVLLAPGARPRRMSVPGADVSNVFRLQSRGGAAAFAEALRACQQRGAGLVLIIGAGLIGMEAASALRARGMEVHVAAPELLPLSGLLGPRAAVRLLKAHREQGTRFHLGVTVRELRGETGRVRSAVLSDGTEVEADVILAALGVEPAVDFLQGSGLVKDGIIPVDRRLSTPAAGIFAAGDAALVPYGQEQRPERVGHWADAQRQGAAAARAMLGAAGGEFTDERFFWTDQCGISFRGVGRAVGSGQVVFIGSPDEGDYLAGHFLGGRLAGAVAVGYGQELAAISAALRQGVRITPRSFPEPARDPPQGG